MRKKNLNLNDKILKLNLIHSLEESNLYLNLLNNQLKIYETQLEFLNCSKPSFFQKKKLIEHQRKTKEYEEKIKEIRQKIEKEINLIINNKKNINF